MRLVDSLSEQEILEKALENSKPPILPGDGRHFHFLLSTPFRYSPHRLGSRFRRREQRSGVFYAAEEVVTALCEIAFYRFLFLADAPDAKAPSNPVEHTAFSVTCASDVAVDLTASPFSAGAAVWESLDHYEPCQAFADNARAAGVSIIRYTSVRDLLRRANVALMDQSTFQVTRPISQQTWRIIVKPDVVIALCEHPKEQWEFPLTMFLADPRLLPLKPKS
jgi:hypothetical protein